MNRLILAFIFSFCSVVSSLANDDDNPAIWALQEAARFANHKPIVGNAYSGNLQQLVTASANRHKVPVHIAHAVVKVESGYRCGARSRSGAVGIMQTLPATARGMGVSGRLTDCATGLEAGMRYLSAIVRTFGTGCAALGLYERGMYARPVCTSYGKKVLRLAKA